MSTIERAAAKLGKAIRNPATQPDNDALPIGGAAQRRQAPVDGHRAFRSSTADRGPEDRDILYDRISDGRSTGGQYQQLDLASLTTDGFVTKDNSKSVLASDFRRIKRPLLLNMKVDAARKPDARPPNLILITSALPGEGKTFVSINLALSVAAEVDSSVLLVDGDPLKDDVARVLGIQYDYGLVDVLQQGRHPEGAVVATNVEGLSVLPAGYTNDSPDELFASEIMQQTLYELAAQDEHRVVLIDAPPLMVGTMSSVLSRICGQVVMVVEAERTPQATVAEAVGLIDGCESVSLMLNKATRRQSEHLNYGYGYGYGYGA